MVELLAVVAIISVLGALIFTGLNVARKQANKAQSCQNMRQIAGALLLYSSENAGKFPSLMSGGRYIWSWDLQLLPYLGGSYNYSGSPIYPTLEKGLKLDVFTCPLDDRSADSAAGYYPRSYGLPGVSVNQPGGDFTGGVAREIGEGISLFQIPNPAKYVLLCRMPRNVEVTGNTVGQIGNCLTNGPNPVNTTSEAAIKDWKIFDGETPYAFADGHLQMLTATQAAPLWPYRWRADN